MRPGISGTFIGAVVAISVPEPRSPINARRGGGVVRTWRVELRGCGGRPGVPGDQRWPKENRFKGNDILNPVQELVPSVAAGHSPTGSRTETRRWQTNNKLVVNRTLRLNLDAIS